MAQLVSKTWMLVFEEGCKNKKYGHGKMNTVPSMAPESSRGVEVPGVLFAVLSAEGGLSRKENSKDRRESALCGIFAWASRT